MTAIIEQPDTGGSTAGLTLADVLTLERIGPMALQAPVWGRPGPPRVYGGQLVAQALAAAVAASPGLSIRSLHGRFLAAGDTTRPLNYLTESRTEAGDAYVVTARQGDAEVFHLLASFAEPSDDEAISPGDGASPPGVPNAAPVVAPQATDDPWIRALEEAFPLDIRFVGLPPRTAIARGDRPEPYVATWLRSHDPLPPDPQIHAAALAYMSDLFLLSSALLPHGCWVGDPGLSIASLDHAMWFHRQARADDWVFYERRAVWAGGGRAVARGTITDTAGNVLVTVMQEGLIRRRAPTSGVHA